MVLSIPPNNLIIKVWKANTPLLLIVHQYMSSKAHHESGGTFEPAATRN
jgi:hypothetical protein